MARPLPEGDVLRVATPDPFESAALLQVARYLQRAGTDVASRALALPPWQPEAVLLADLRDSLLAAASLCSGVLELAGDRNVAPLAGGREGTTPPLPPS